MKLLATCYLIALYARTGKDEPFEEEKKKKKKTEEDYELHAVVLNKISNYFFVCKQN